MVGRRAIGLYMVLVVAPMIVFVLSCNRPMTGDSQRVEPNSVEKERRMSALQPTWSIAPLFFLACFAKSNQYLHVGRMYASVTHGNGLVEHDFAKVMRVGLIDGKLHDYQALGDFEVDVLQPVSDDLCLVGVHLDNDSRVYLVDYDRGTHRTIAKRDFPVFWLRIVGDMVILPAATGCEAVNWHTGKVMWAASELSNTHPPAVSSGGAAYFAVGDHGVRAIAVQDGSTLWDSSIRATPLKCVGRQQVICVSKDRIVVVSQSSGNLNTSTAVQANQRCCVLDNGDVVLSDSSGTRCLDMAGKQRWSTNAAYVKLYEFPDMIVALDETKRFSVLRPTTGEVWATISADGDWRPVVASGSALYLTKWPGQIRRYSLPR